jgi:hypothetical protein
MNQRVLTSLGITAVVIALAAVLLAQVPAAAQAPKAAATTAAATPAPAAKPLAPPKPAAQAKSGWTVPRTPDGVPDLQGYWTNNSYTPLERPNGVTKDFYSLEELRAVEKKNAEREEEQTTPGTVADVHYDFTQFGLDRSQTRIADNLRTSVITNPENGKLPPVTPEGLKRAADRAAERKKQGAQYDQVQNIPIGSRCVYMNAAPPMMPPAYNPAYQIVQSPGYVTILVEMLHETRVIPTDGRPHAPAGVRSWLGDSKGHWEGDTLVVETTNFNDKVAFRGASENVKITERFTRTSDDAIRYEFTVDDPSTWERAWKGEMPFVKIGGPIFEHACNEGNYGIANTLAGARREDKKAAEDAAKKAGAK